ncbi:MAG: ArsR/SmtB family transcription factor [Fusobacteriaceae bacterium]
MEKQMEILKALAHSVRLNIVYLLKDCDSRCVCDIQSRQENLSQSSLSQHLKILRDAEIVTCEKKGGWVHYSLKNKEILDVLDKLKAL